MSDRRKSERPSAGAPARPARPDADPTPEDGDSGRHDAEAEAEPETGSDGPEAPASVTAEGKAAQGQDPAAEPADDGAGEEPAAVEPADALARAEVERDEYLALAQRTQADFDNYRKRSARELAAAGTRAKAALAREVLPAVDNLERALESATDAEDGLAEGLRLVHSELVAALERNGVASIEPEGQEFDPTIHEALSTRAENGAPAGVVLDVVQKGYRLDHTVLRPARVVVAA